jgi:predicted nuclease of restriction endonuclease-like (RecB) superfamily
MVGKIEDSKRNAILSGGLHSTGGLTKWSCPSSHNYSFQVENLTKAPLKPGQLGLGQQGGGTMKEKPTAILKKEKVSLYERIRQILESARTNMARTVNTTQVVANWLIGREIVEEEQRGHNRAEYGHQLIEQLSEQLKADFGSGYSTQNLFYMRQFYRSYPSLIPSSKILHALRGKSSPKYEVAEKLHAVRGKFNVSDIPDATPRKLAASPVAPVFEIRHALCSESWQPGHLHPNLSWTHYRTLLRVDKMDVRAFYEIEAIQNNWSSRELERQINSLLYERLALSRDKKGLLNLAMKGQTIQKPADIFKDPMVMEFLGLPASPKLVESKLEQALIDNLQNFLLELGKGFAFISRYRPRLLSYGPQVLRAH